jgi:hypothetical protein
MARFTSRKNIVISHDGYMVEIVGARGLRYSEGRRTIEVDSEAWGGERGMTIFAHSVRSWTDAEGATAVSGPDVERVVRNIVAALSFDGYSAEVNWTVPGEPG